MKKTTKQERLGDAPVEPAYQAKMNFLAAQMDIFFNGNLKGNDRPTGFVLLVFPFDGPGNDDGRCNFISNGANRKDIVTLFKEMIQRFEGQPEQKGTA